MSATLEELQEKNVRLSEENVKLKEELSTLKHKVEFLVDEKSQLQQRNEDHLVELTTVKATCKAEAKFERAQLERDLAEKGVQIDALRSELEQYRDQIKKATEQQNETYWSWFSRKASETLVTVKDSALDQARFFSYYSPLEIRQMQAMRTHYKTFVRPELPPVFIVMSDDCTEMNQRPPFSPVDPQKFKLGNGPYRHTAASMLEIMCHYQIQRANRTWRTGQDYDPRSLCVSELKTWVVEELSGMSGFYREQPLIQSRLDYLRALHKEADFKGKIVTGMTFLQVLERMDTLLSERFKQIMDKLNDEEPDDDRPVPSPTLSFGPDGRQAGPAPLIPLNAAALAAPAPTGLYPAIFAHVGDDGLHTPLAPARVASGTASPVAGVPVEQSRGKAAAAAGLMMLGDGDYEDEYDMTPGAPATYEILE